MRHVIGMGTFASLAVGLVASPVAAQQTSPANTSPTANQSADPEIVVTAQKREQRLQDVGVSVTAIGADGLARLGHQDVTALANQVPSLQVNQYSPTITVFNLRGVSQNDFADSQEAPIAFYNDEVYISALGAISGQTFDLERVEVLRGPQGTLFGRNATGGLVQLITAKPTRDFEGFGTLSIGSYNQVASEAAISGPLSDNVRARLSFSSDSHGGYIKNRIGRDLGNGRFYAGRLQVESDIGSTGSLLLKAELLRNAHETSGGIYSYASAGFNADGLGFALAPDQDFYGTGPGANAFGYKEPDNDPFTGSYDRNGFFDRTYWNLGARYQQSIGAVDLVSITNYQRLDKKYGEDSDMSPLPIFNYDTKQKLDQFSQELRISGKSSTLDWVAGGYFLHINTRNQYQVDASTLLGFIENYGGTQKTDSFAFFGQGEYHFTPQLSLILGARYSRDQKSYDFSHAENGVTDLMFNTTTYPNLAKRTFENWSGKAQINYKPTNDILLYFGLNRGTKSGGFGVQAFAPIDPASLPYGQEVLTNYEGGFKLTLLDRKLTLNGSAFRYVYKDYQAFSLQGLSQFITNNPARLWGLELETNWRPTRRFTIGAYITYLNTVVHDITLPGGRVTDRKLPQAPEWSIGGNLRYELPVGPGRLAFSTDWKYNSSQYFSTFNAPIDLEPAYTVGNARISFTTGEKDWEVAFFVNNLTDKWYRVYNLDLGAALSVANQTYARPRWFGGSISYRWR